MKRIIVLMIVAIVMVQSLQHGRLRTYSDSSDGNQIIETNATYPNGRKWRDVIATSDQLMCASCDPIDRQELCFSDYCVHLGDTAVFVFLNNNTLKETLQLNGCSPRYLQPSTATETIIFVLCHPTETGQPQYQQLDFNGQQFELTSKIISSGNSFPLTPHNGVFSGGRDHFFFPQDFYFYIGNNEVYLEVVGVYDIPLLLNFQSQAAMCDSKDALHAVPARGNKPRFLLNCTKSNLTKWFVVTVDTPEDSSLQVTEIIHSTGGTPFASVTVVAFVSDNNLTVYEMANLRQYPGTKTFSGPIKQIDFLGSNQFLVIVSGQNHSLIDIPLFVQTGVQLQGVAELPGSVAYCPIGGTCLPHKLINQDTLVLFIRNRTFYDAIFYNLTNPTQRLGTLPRFINRPQVVFYDLLPVADPPPTTFPTILHTSTSPSPPTSLLTPSPSPPPTPTIDLTTTSNPVSSLSIPSFTSNPVVDPSSVLPDVPPSSLPLEPTPIGPTDDDSQQTPIAARLTDEAAIIIAVTVAIAALFIILMAVVLVGRYMYRRFCIQIERIETPKQESQNAPPRHEPLGRETDAVSSASSSDEEPPTTQADSQASSGYCTSQASSLRDTSTPPDGTSQGGNIPSAPATFPPCQTSSLVTGHQLPGVRLPLDSLQIN